jgi:hypothetical protein
MRRLRKSLRWFFAEFLVVVVGILVAIALNGWYQSRADAASERDYLSFLSRDLQGTLDDLASQAAFEQAQIKDGVMVYQALSTQLPADTMPLSEAISRLSQRKTMIVKNSTYQDLVNTGNIRLIRNHALRDHVIAFYETAALQIEVLNNNNATYVDQMFDDKIILSGLIMTRNETNYTLLSAATSVLDPELHNGFLQRRDRLWNLPADAPEWSMVRSNIVMRLRVAALNNYIAANRTIAARKLKSEVDAELAHGGQ